MPGPCHFVWFKLTLLSSPSKLNFKFNTERGIIVKQKFTTTQLITLWYPQHTHTKIMVTVESTLFYFTTVNGWTRSASFEGIGHLNSTILIVYNGVSFFFVFFIGRGVGRFDVDHPIKVKIQPWAQRTFIENLWDRLSIGSHITVKIEWKKKEKGNWYRENFFSIMDWFD